VPGTRRNPIHEAAIQADWSLREIGRELRLARIAAGLSQRQVASALGWSQARVSHVEHGQYPSARLRDLSRFAAVVGMRLWSRVYPGVRHVVDGPQLALLGRLHRRVDPAAGWDLEVPMPIEGDLRAADGRIRLATCSVLVEAITRLADAQAQVRAAQRKRRDLGCDHLILLIGETGANRRALHEAGHAFVAAFPITQRAALRALAAGRDPGGDAIILL
jgi:transcriptional regulator with XRE-family HTH domain